MVPGKTDGKRIVNVYKLGLLDDKYYREEYIFVGLHVILLLHFVVNPL